MTFARDLFSDLVEKRLWPLALGLLVALVAVPVALSRSGEDQGTAGVPPSRTGLLGRSSAALLGETRPVVSLSGDGGFRKHVARLGRKNPFVPQARPQAASSEQLTVGGNSAGGETGSSVGGTAPVTTTPTTPNSQPTVLYQYAVKIKFGKIGSTSKKTVRGGDFLPSETSPVVLSLGASSDGESALFLPSAEVTVHGDGKCVPSESSCQILQMKKGDTEFLELAQSDDTVTTYELDVVDIVLREVSTTSAADRALQSEIQRLRLDSQRLRQMRHAMRAKRVFKALDQLSF